MQKPALQPASSFQIGNNGEKANTQIVVYMSQETKATIEAEFPQYGATDWQSMMAILINNRKNLLSKPLYQSQTPPPPTKRSINKNWIIASLILFLIVTLFYLFKTQKIPQITFQP